MKKYYANSYHIIAGILLILMGIWLICSQVQPAQAAPPMQPAQAVQSIQPEAVQAEKQASSGISQYDTVSPSVYTLSMSTLHGEKVSLAEFKGKTVYIKFWATWCSLCLAGLEEFTALQKQYTNSQDVAILSVVTPGLNREVSKQDFIAWAKSQQLEFPILLDETGALTKEFGIRVYPSGIYLNKHGQIIKKTVGDEAGKQIQSTLAMQQ